jgi:glycosyltransferase involved in cell wall biosynthesis
MNDPNAHTTSILCIGMGWFPQTPGGLDRYVYELTQHLAAANDQVELCGVGLPKTPLDGLIALTNLADPEQPLLPRLWLANRQFRQRQIARPDAINLHFALYSLPLLSSLPKDVPVTFTFHGPWALESQQEGASQRSVMFKRWIEQQVYRRCDRFITLSKAFGTILHQEYGIDWEKIHVIPGGVDTNRFQLNLSRQEARTQLNWHSDRVILFTPRRLVQRMGLDKLLLALKQVKTQVPEVWLAIAGKGPVRSTLEGQVLELGLENHVTFLGFIPDEQLPLAYQAADLCVVPSQSLEGFGLIVLESLACGTPTLCTPVGGMPEIVAPFTPQLVTTSSEPDDLARHLIEVLSGKLEMPSRAACRTYAMAHFDWQQICRRVRAVLLQQAHSSTRGLLP